MLGLGYQMLSFAKVTNLATLYKGTLPELSKLKLIVENVKILFKLPQNCISVEVAEGERVYKIILLETGVHKNLLGYFMYLPLERRLDAYTAENLYTPILQWKQKRVVYYGYPMFFDRAGIASLFNSLVNII